MKTSLIVSGILHLVLFAAIFLNFSSSQNSVAPPLGPVPIEITATSETTEQKAGKADGKADKTTPPKLDEKKSDAAPEPVPTPQVTEKPAIRQAAAAPPPPTKVEPTPEPEKKAEPEKAAEVEKKPEPEAAPPEKKPEPPKPKKVEEKPKPKPKPKPEPEKDRIADIIRPKAPEQPSKFDPNRISALLNKDPTAGDVAPSEQQPKLGRPPSSFQDQALGVERGAGDKLTANELDAFVQRMSECWDLPGGLGGDVVQVKLRIELRATGDLARPPQIVNFGNSPFFQAAADSAVRAVQKCAPYSFMPADKYDQWRDMTLNFNPSQMLR